MSTEQQQILEMVRDGKITAEEAERLLKAVGTTGHFAAHSHTKDFPGFWGSHRGRRRRRAWHDKAHAHHHPHGEARFVRIEIDEKTEEGLQEKVRLKIPFKLLKAGINLSGLMPREARERIAAKLKAKGIEVDPFSLRDVDDLEEALDDLDLDLDGTKIRVCIVREGDEDDGVEVEQEVEVDERRTD